MSLLIYKRRKSGANGRAKRDGRRTTAFVEKRAGENGATFFHYDRIARNLQALFSVFCENGDFSSLGNDKSDDGTESTASVLAVASILTAERRKRKKGDGRRSRRNGKKIALLGTRRESGGGSSFFSIFRYNKGTRTAKRTKSAFDAAANEKE